MLALGPILLIITALVGFFYGDAAARGALLGKLSSVMGFRTADFLQSAIKSAGSHGAGVAATIFGVVSLVVTATGAFGELQSALNAIWRAQPKGSTMRQLVRSRLLSLGLVLILALVLVVSLVLSALIVGLQHQLDRLMPVPAVLIGLVNFVLSLVLLAGLVAAVYKVLPDRDLDWRDVAAGAIVTAVLITLGKVAMRNLHRQQRHYLRLWRCRFRHRRPVLDLLFRPDFPARRGIHPRLRRTRGIDQAFTCRINAAQRSRIGST